jgi:chromosomal replication initiator protein
VNNLYTYIDLNKVLDDLVTFLNSRGENQKAFIISGFKIKKMDENEVVFGVSDELILQKSVHLQQNLTIKEFFSRFYEESDFQIRAEIMEFLSEKNMEDEEYTEATEEKKDKTDNLEEGLSNLFDINQDNTEYTFDNFVVGPSNDFAYASAKNIASFPKSNINPFFIYGGVGLGKTHLLKAIAYERKKHNPKSNVVYVSCETLMNKFIEALKKKNFKEFQTIRGVDVLLVDDVQFLTNKVSFQEEFYNIFNALYEKDKQIILAADRTPQQIQGLADRLVSRFKSGVTADIQLPDLETRIVIIRNLAEKQGKPMNARIAEYLAIRMNANVRELRAVFTQIFWLSSINKCPIDEKLIDEVLNKYFPNQEKPRLTPEKIREYVAREYNVSVEEMLSDSRTQNVTMPRHVAMYLIRELTDKTFKEIASFFSRRDHGSVMHAGTKVEEFLKNNRGEEEALKIQEIKNYLTKNFER